jgi:hypothetical protein
MGVTKLTCHVRGSHFEFLVTQHAGADKLAEIVTNLEGCGWNEESSLFDSCARGTD